MVPHRGGGHPTVGRPALAPRERDRPGHSRTGRASGRSYHASWASGTPRPAGPSCGSIRWSAETSAARSRAACIASMSADGHRGRSVDPVWICQNHGYAAPREDPAPPAPGSQWKHGARFGSHSSSLPRARSGRHGAPVAPQLVAQPNIALSVPAGSTSLRAGSTPETGRRATAERGRGRFELVVVHPHQVTFLRREPAAGTPSWPPSAGACPA